MFINITNKNFNNNVNKNDNGFSGTWRYIHLSNRKNVYNLLKLAMTLMSPEDIYINQTKNNL